MVESAAIFMENQLIIGSNQLILKNNNLRSIKFNNNFFGDKYFNIRKKFNLTCEEQDTISLKAL